MSENKKQELKLPNLLSSISQIEKVSQLFLMVWKIPANIRNRPNLDQSLNVDIYIQTNALLAANHLF